MKVQFTNCVELWWKRWLIAGGFRPVWCCCETCYPWKPHWQNSGELHIQSMCCLLNIMLPAALPVFEMLSMSD